MRTKCRAILRVLMIATVGLCLGVYSFGQSGSTDEGKRKVKSKVSPAYPELAKRMNVTGKVKIEVVVSDENLGPAIEAIRGAAQTGRIGDGKIFVSQIDEAIRIRTGETGADAV